jgi:hypothetical protein
VDDYFDERGAHVRAAELVAEHAVAKAPTSAPSFARYLVARG